MRIVIAHSRLNTFGGGERVVLELLRRLATRHDVALWAGDYHPNATFAEFQEYAPRRISPRGWLLHRPDADAVIANGFGANLLALRHPRTICYLHTARAPYQRDSAHPALALRRRLETAALERASAVLTNSAYTAGRIASIYGRDAEVLPPGANDAYFSLPAQAGTYALYVGRLAPEKGIERLIRWSMDARADLVVAGAGDPAYERHLRSLAPPHVRFVGALTGPDLAAAYAGCRYLAFTPYAEEFGIAALDAMAAARPVIATAEGGLTELVRDGETGFLVRNADEFAAASNRLLPDDALCERLGGRGREIARGYSWDRLAARIEQLCAGQRKPDDILC